VIPTGISIYRGGASKGASISFLISTPQTGVDSVMVTYSLLGLPFAILRPIVALITGVFGGMATNLWAREEEKANAAAEKETHDNCTSCAASGNCPNDSSYIAQLPWPSKLYEAARYALVDFFGDVSKSLLVGLLLAALIAVLVPDDFFKSYITSDLLGMFVILIVSIPLYVCATSSVPIAAVLLAKGLSPGAALVFLMAGPATNAATITMLGSVMGRRALLTYLGTIVVGALCFGLIIDNFLPREWFTPTMSHGHAHDTLLPVWLQIGSSIVFVIALAYALLRQFFPKQHLVVDQQKTASAEPLVLKVEGMTCSHCKKLVEETVQKLEGVDRAEANLAHGTLTVTGSPDLTQITQSLESIGHRAVSQ
jgi:uncharacterized membrane protein YraQ (UPF0718 family)/copper chaperone CopZ